MTKYQVYHLKNYTTTNETAHDTPTRVPSLLSQPLLWGSSCCQWHHLLSALITSLCIYLLYKPLRNHHNRRCHNDKQTMSPHYERAIATLSQETTQLQKWMRLVTSFFSSSHSPPSPSTATLLRKKAFLQRTQQNYGYATSPRGHIDTWRTTEYPHLHPPLSSQTPFDNTDIYLDYAGSALPSQRQLRTIYEKERRRGPLANPHSSGPVASRTSGEITRVTHAILSFLGCHPVSPRGEGYDVVYTSGTTAALKSLAEYFPFGRKSVLVYTRQAHTSVVGIREVAVARGGKFVCVDWTDVVGGIDEGVLRNWQNGGEGEEKVEESNGGAVVHQGDSHPPLSTKMCQCDTSSQTINHLLVLPLECNVTGDRIPLTTISHIAQLFTTLNISQQKHKWYIAVDAAKYAATAPLKMCHLGVDFAALSFYKIFGAPTGLGALLVKRACVDVLVPPAPCWHGSHKRRRTYFGGGSIDAMIPSRDFAAGRSDVPLKNLTHGTVHFRGIVGLEAGLEEMASVGGMEMISKHANALARELERRLDALHHPTHPPTPVAIVYHHTPSPLSGPTVTFNLRRPNGDYVGYAEITKLASLHRIQFRSGCFCNPGACQSLLGWSDEEVLENYVTKKHVCGDDADLIDGRPTGAVRVSFGKESTWEDLDGLMTFIERYFVTDEVSLRPLLSLVPSKQRQQQRCPRLSEMYIYPIKSCAPQRVKRWSVDPKTGRLSFDREFALVDEHGAVLRLQHHPIMASLHPTIDVETNIMRLSCQDVKEDLILRLDEWDDIDEHTVKVCGNECGGVTWGESQKASRWLTSRLGVTCYLARFYSSDRNKRPPSPLTESRQGFVNEAPILLLSQGSVTVLNDLLVSRGEKGVTAHQFRPNLVADCEWRQPDTNDTNPEDQWTTVTINPKRQQQKSMRWTVTGRCARCAMVDVNPLSGQKEGRTLRAMADYRRSGGQIYFGIFLSVADDGAGHGISSYDEGDCGGESALMEIKEKEEEEEEEVIWLEEGDELIVAT